MAGVSRMGGDTLDGLCELAAGKLELKIAKRIGISRYGCKWRGSPVCLRCPFADRIARLCDYQCGRCEDRERCPCGQDDQDLAVDLALGSRQSDQ